jgi:hypothetical protein
LQKLLGQFRFILSPSNQAASEHTTALPTAWPDRRCRRTAFGRSGGMPGKGKLTATRSLAKSERAKSPSRASPTVRRRRPPSWKLKDDFYKRDDIHIHFP